MLTDCSIFGRHAMNSVHGGRGGLPDRDPHWTEIPTGRKPPFLDRDPPTLKCGRYASYLNAFLCFHVDRFLGLWTAHHDFTAINIQ